MKHTYSSEYSKHKHSFEGCIKQSRQSSLYQRCKSD